MRRKQEELQPLMTSASGTNVRISIQGAPTGQGVVVNYITDTSNQPQKYANHIYVWQTTEHAVPWGKDPDGAVAIDTNSSNSTQFVDFAFEDKGYIIGYATAPDPKAVCSTIFIPQDKQNFPTDWEYDAVTSNVVNVSTNLVQAQYHTLNRYTPATYKNWLALFLGSYASYTAIPMKTVNVPTDSADGYLVIQGVRLLIGTTYTVAYLMVPEAETGGRTSIAASSTFTVGAT